MPSEYNFNLFLGMQSGTSMDGVDVALVQIQEKPAMGIQLLRFQVYPYPEPLSEELWKVVSRVKTLRDIPLALHDRLGEFLAQCALQFLQEGKEEVKAIGSHGQTVLHRPKEGYSIQLGNPQIISTLTGLPVVANFREADIQAGGEGAPLTPLLDYYLFSHPEKGRVLVNLGGICNLTYLPPKGTKDEVLGFDAGPANTLLDRFVRESLKSVGETLPGVSTEAYDRDGQWAQRGRVDEQFVVENLQHPYFLRPPPKSADIHDFDEIYSALLERRRAQKMSDFYDFCATLTEFVARALEKAVIQFIPGPIHEIYLTGGGAFNPVLVHWIQSAFQKKGIPVMVGLPEIHTGSIHPFHHKAKEAVLFALLAHHRIYRIPGNLPRVTGASHEVILGNLYEPVSVA